MVKRVRNLPMNSGRAKSAGKVARVEPIAGDVVMFNYDRLGDRAKATRQTIARIKRRSLDSLKAFVDVGNDLARIKRTLRRGEWLPLLEAELGMSDRQARRFMRAAELAKGKTGGAACVSPSLLLEILSEGTPEAAKEEILSRAAAGERVTLREGRKAIASAKGKPSPSPEPLALPTPAAAVPAALPAPIVVEASSVQVEQREEEPQRAIVELQYPADEVQQRAEEPDVEELAAALFRALVAKSRREDEEDGVSPEFIERVYSRLQERDLAPILISLKNVVEREVIAAIGEVSTRRAPPTAPATPAAPLEKAGENGDIGKGEARIPVDKARLAHVAAALARIDKNAIIPAGVKPVAPAEEEPFIETVRYVEDGHEFD